MAGKGLSMQNNKILIVEDDIDLLENIVEYLALERFEAVGTGCALDFYQQLCADNFNIAIVDIGLPDRSGFEIVDHLRRNTNLGIIIITARDGMSDKVRGYESGADYYFVKPVDSSELVASIHDLLRRFSGALGESTPIVAKGYWSLNLAHGTLVSSKGVKIELTTKENNFLKLLIEEQASPVSRQILLQELGYHLEGPYGNRALDVLIVRLRKKIKVLSGESPIKTIHSFGYSFTAQVHQI